VTEDETIKTTKEGLSIVTEIMKAAGDDANVKEAAGNLGQTAVTLTKTINNIILPLAAVNFGFEKARIYFSEKFQKDITEKTENIPPEYLVQPKASVAGPTLQGLAFTHEEQNLKDMFLNLLATSMDGRKADIAHPAFVEIIKQMDSEDARLVQETLKSTSPIPIIEIYANMNDGAGKTLMLRHVLNLKDTDTGEISEDPKLPAMVDNWIRLGLVTVDYNKQIVDPRYYSWAEQRPEYLNLCNTLNSESQKVEYNGGIIFRTEFGKQFAAAIALQ